MIVDSSAVVAVFVREPRYEELADMMMREPAAIGAPTLAETGLVLTAKIGTPALGALARFVQELGIETVPFGQDHWREAIDAFARFGRGRHPAALNFGDCLTYAVARLAREPLLCTGKDFAKTDLELV